MRLASEPRNLRLPKLAARSKKVRNTALMYNFESDAVIGCSWSKLEPRHRLTSGGSSFPDRPDNERCSLPADHLRNSGRKNLPTTDI